MKLDLGVALSVAMLLLGCAHRSEPVPQDLPPPCPAPAIDTTGWVLVKTIDFSIRLPRGARDTRGNCFDMVCGAIRVGSWELGYGDGLGASERTVIPPDASNGRICSEEIDGRTVNLATYEFRQTGETGDSRRFAAQAGMLVFHMPLSLSVGSKDSRAIAQFLVAIRTIHAPVPH